MCVHHSLLFPPFCELLYQNTETWNPCGNTATQKCGLSCSEVGCGKLRGRGLCLVVPQKPVLLPRVWHFVPGSEGAHIQSGHS